MTRGGTRPGAGRPKSQDRRKLINIKLDALTRAYLDYTGDKTGTIEVAIKTSEGFRRWKAKQ